MNIFYTFDSPKKCAEVLDDLRVNKMIIESAQILSTVIHKNIDNINDIYKSTHVNHPCTIWAGLSSAHFEWLFDHYIYLIKEFANRNNKSHKSGDIKDNIFNYYKSINFKTNEFITPPACNPYKQQIDYDICTSYKYTMLDKWSNFKIEPKWNKKHLSIDEQKTLLGL